MQELGQQVKATQQEMTVRAENVARRMLWGQDHVEIQRELGITKRQFEHITIRDEFKDLLTKLGKDTYSELDERYREKLGDAQELAKRTTYESMEKLIVLMRASEPRLQRDCANDIIEYGGMIRKEVKAAAPNITQLQINLISAALKEDDERSGNGNSGKLDNGGSLTITTTRAQ